VSGATPGQPSHVVVESPNKPRPDDQLARSVADTLRRIENNYHREGSGPGSRFEGQLLEDVQARTAIAMARVHQAEEAAQTAPRADIALAALRAISVSHEPDSAARARQALEDIGEIGTIVVDLDSAAQEPHKADELNAALDGLYSERKQVTELRDVLTEIFTCLDTGDPALLFDADQIAEWRQRAEMPS
jgi:hypothetical protein